MAGQSGKRICPVLVNDSWRVIPSARNRGAREIAMGTRSGLAVIGETAPNGGRLARREMVRRLLAGVSAGAAWPLVAASHPIHELLRNGAILKEAEKLGAA